MFKFENIGNMLMIETVIVALITVFTRNQYLNIILVLLLIYHFYTYRKGYFSKLNFEHKKYVKAIEALNGAIWEWYEEYEVLFISSRYKYVFNTEDNIDSFEKFYSYVNLSDREWVKSLLEDYVNNHKENDFVFTFKTTFIDDEVLYIECSGKGKMINGKYELGGIFIDVTEKKLQEEKLKISEKNYRRAIEGSRELMFYFKVDEGIYYIKDRNGIIFSKRKNIENKLTNEEWMEKILIKDKHIYLKSYTDFLDNEEKFFCAEYRIKGENSDVIWIKHKGKRVVEEDGLYIYGSMSNISDSKEKETQIYYMSNYDDVTGLPNRRYFTEKAEALLEENNKTIEKVPYLSALFACWIVSGAY